MYVVNTYGIVHVPIQIIRVANRTHLYAFLTSQEIITKGGNY